MKFDHTFIAIRKRTVLEIYDLALHVWRDYFGPLALLLLLGAMPWVVLDWLLVGWMIDEAHFDQQSRAYVWLMLCLIVSQAQTGTAMMTHYMGQAMFVGKPDIRASFKAIWSVPFIYYWTHYVLRMLMPIAFLAWIYRFNKQQDMRVIISLLLAALLVVGLIVRAVRPFVTKIMVLEKAPRRASVSNPIAFGKRSISLHGGGADLFGRFLLSLIFGTALGAGTFGLIYTLYSWLGFKVGLGYVEAAVFWPLTLWLIAGFLSVVRFLSYIDLRIRQEGWEVELSIKAEAVRLQQGGQA